MACRTPGSSNDSVGLQRGFVLGTGFAGSVTFWLETFSMRPEQAQEQEERKAS